MSDDLARLGSRLDDLTTRVRAVEATVTQHEQWIKVTESQTQHIDRRFAMLEGRLDKIDTSMSRLVWLILAGIVSGGMTFVMSGGLSLVAP